MCRSRLLFTSRNRAAQGLRLKVDKRPVGCLGDEASRQVLLAGGVQLDDAQLQVALDFCKGLPLALTLLNGALRAEDDPADVIHHLGTHGTFSVDKEDQLVSALTFSVECLSEELQTGWLDLAWMYAHDAPPRGAPVVPLQELKNLFGEHTLQKLLDRNLITVKSAMPPGGFEMDLPYAIVPGGGIDMLVQVVLHDVLLRMAEHLYGPHGKNYCLTVGRMASISLSEAVKVCSAH
jgi:hypothetical protein